MEGFTQTGQGVAMRDAVKRPEDLPGYVQDTYLHASSWENNGQYNQSDVPDEVWICTGRGWTGDHTCVPNDEGRSGVPAHGDLPGPYAGGARSHIWKYHCNQ
ncbi:MULTISPECIES: hypothetical protein [unclassified Streptomyces]|uniref:hypothetical protein n=1 Tax=unclassified Streptomyces TaxID=2593676 RepID=UPI0037F9326E